MSGISRGRKITAAVALAVIFVWFTWRGLIMFFSGDDMMNMYAAWNLNPWRLGRSLLFIWMPIYRPLGAVIYRAFYETFGFHPLPLYIFCWILLAVNAVLAYRFFRQMLGIAMLAFSALLLTMIHGDFQDLYLSAGTIYDRLWFLFTVLGLTVYAKHRQRSAIFVCLLCILSMDSKESGVALPVLIVLYDLIFVLPGRPFRAWLRQVSPLFSVLTVLSVIFVFLRVRRTPELAMTPAYTPHASLVLWFHRIAGYFTLLAYRHLQFSAVTAALVLVAMTAIAFALRNRAMIFGLAFFVVTITPVALIASRPGYVLYVPDLGLGLYFAALIGAIPGLNPELAFAILAIGVTWFDARNWPPREDPHLSPEYRLTSQFTRDFPKMPPGSHLLFVSDAFPKPAYDLLFNLRLMYGDKSLNADRMEAPQNQQPDPAHPVEYQHIFTNYSGYYLELDNRNPSESIRLHILKNYTVGRQMDISSRDHAAYVVSGLMDGDNPDPSRWTEPHAEFKFDLYPAPAVFHAKFWVPDFVARTASRTITVTVNGKQIGSLPLSRDGMNEIGFPTPADSITLNGFTLVDMDVQNPWKDKDGTSFGVVLLNAGFDYMHRN